VEFVADGFAVADGVLWAEEQVRWVVEDDEETFLAVPLLCREDLLVEALAHFGAEDVELCQFVAVVELRCLPLPNYIVEHLAVVDAGDGF
jgi:hypothetical protein